ncbi:MAG: hypothetical protein INR73_02825 [Williamsia sp.]|nr:hypothetical protein [Williamsia sp.]
MPLSYSWYRMLLITALVLVAVSFIPVKNTIDLHIHDTYFVLSHATLYTTLAAFLTLTGLISMAANKFLYSSWLARVHIILTLTILLTLLILFYIHTSFILTRQATGPDINSLMQIYRTGQFIAVLLLLMLATQLLLPVNLVLGLFKTRYRSRQE